MKKTNLFFLIFLCGFFVSLHADKPKVVVTANHADWLYQINEQVVFKIAVLKNGKPMKGVKVFYQIGPEKMPATFKGSVLIKDEEIEIEGGTLQTGGFLRCIATVEYEGKKIKGLATVAFSPETIKPTTTMPDDFTAFWTKAIAQNAKIPMNPQMVLLPDRSTDKVNVYQVNFQNHKLKMHVYGILSIPKAPGKYPAVLKVPGAGVRAYKGDLKLAEKGVITLEIGIHGIPVTLDARLYEDLKFGALKNYYTFNLDDPNNYYYKRVYLGCLRANDFIFSLPEFDGVNLLVSGRSQGGALAIVTAALDKRVKAIVCFYPALSDLMGYLNGRAGGWPHIFQKTENASAEKVATSQYYDVVNFARLITVPGFYSFGYNDETCPPTSIYASLNSINAPKTLFIAKETGHFTTAEQQSAQAEYILKMLNVSY
jgi:cephalosporin-C deacetylase